MADLTQVEASVAQDEQGVVIPIMDKNGDPYLGADGKPSTMTVLGSDAKKVRLASEAIQRRAIRMRGRVTPADLKANAIDAATAAVTAWSGWEDKSQPLACTPENVRTVLAFDHIRFQVEEGIDGHARFFPSSSKS